MKRILPVFLIFLTSCIGMSVDQDKAKAVCENLMLAIKAEKFDHLSDSYTKDFFQKTKETEWVDALKKMNERLGPIVNYKLMETNIQHSVGERSYIALNYEVQHAKFKSHFIFTVIEENGKHKILEHEIKSDAL
jgi:hypothetical protein